MAGTIEGLDATAIRSLVVGGDLSPTQVVEQVLHHLGRVEGELHTMLHVTAERARAEARCLKRALADGVEPGPLCGVPVTVKDSIWTRDSPTTIGSALFRDFRPPTDALCVRRLAAAGAILIGKSNLPELAALPRTVNQLSQECVNPRDPSRVAGGSSGGAAAGVAAGVVPIAIGTDAGGSNRIPAAYCGVLGMAPTLGMVPHEGGYRSSSLFTVTGPLTRSVRDAALVMDVLAQPHPEDPVAFEGFPPPPFVTGLSAPVRHPRVRWVGWSGIDERRDERVVALVRAAAETLVGPLTSAVESLADADLLAGFLLMLNTGRYRQVRRHLDDATARTRMSPGVLEQLEQTRGRSAADHADAVEGRFSAVARLRRLLADHDLVATPTVAFVAPAVAEPTVLSPAIEYTFLASYAGYPSLSVPVGLIDGMPVGLQLIARPGCDALLLRAAQPLAGPQEGGRVR